MKTFSKKTLAERLRQARYLLESGWTRGASARRLDGRATDIYSPAAARFCLTGACNRMGSDGAAGFMKIELGATLRSNPTWYGSHGESMTSWNDGVATKKKVLQLVDRTIERLEGEA